ncbi:UNVERIFIED_CONTAM: hypothetical protein GTU68_048762 [Idotea baltica]|nr:hypothetical protein [Idotea baltica]
MFPLGGMTKEVVRKIADSAGLARIARKEESTGICFIGKRDFSSFISQYLKDCPGEFVDVESGQVVGEHRGFHHWTVGQRAKIPGFAWRYYIASKETQSNRIYVVSDSYFFYQAPYFIRTGLFHSLHILLFLQPYF